MASSFGSSSGRKVNQNVNEDMQSSQQLRHTHGAGRGAVLQKIHAAAGRGIASVASIAQTDPSCYPTTRIPHQDTDEGHVYSSDTSAEDAAGDEDLLDLLDDPQDMVLAGDEDVTFDLLDSPQQVDEAADDEAGGEDIDEDVADGSLEHGEESGGDEPGEGDMICGSSQHEQESADDEPGPGGHDDGDMSYRSSQQEEETGAVESAGEDMALVSDERHKEIIEPSIELVRSIKYSRLIKMMSDTTCRITVEVSPVTSQQLKEELPNILGDICFCRINQSSILEIGFVNTKEADATCKKLRLWNSSLHIVYYGRHSIPRNKYWRKGNRCISVIGTPPSMTYQKMIDLFPGSTMILIDYDFLEWKQSGICFAEYETEREARKAVKRVQKHLVLDNHHMYAFLTMYASDSPQLGDFCGQQERNVMSMHLKREFLVYNCNLRILLVEHWSTASVPQLRELIQRMSLTEEQVQKDLQLRKELFMPCEPDWWNRIQSSIMSKMIPSNKSEMGDLTVSQIKHKVIKTRGGLNVEKDSPGDPELDQWLMEHEMPEKGVHSTIISFRPKATRKDIPKEKSEKKNVKRKTGIEKVRQKKDLASDTQTKGCNSDRNIPLQVSESRYITTGSAYTDFRLKHGQKHDTLNVTLQAQGQGENLSLQHNLNHIHQPQFNKEQYRGRGEGMNPIKGFGIAADNNRPRQSGTRGTCQRPQNNSQSKQNYRKRTVNFPHDSKAYPLAKQSDKVGRGNNTAVPDYDGSGTRRVYMASSHCEDHSRSQHVTSGRNSTGHRGQAFNNPAKNQHDHLGYKNFSVGLIDYGSINSRKYSAHSQSGYQEEGSNYDQDNGSSGHNPITHYTMY